MASAGNDDHFDRLPDAILRLIFNKLHDARSLTRSMAVCKRFASIIPETNAVSLTIPRKISLKQQPCIDPITAKSNCTDSGRESENTNSKSVFKSLFCKTVTTLIRFVLRRILASKSARLDSDGEADCSLYSPNEVLRKFNEIQSLRIEIPKGEIASDGGDSLLRWRAEFGSELESCVIFGAKSLRKRSQNRKDDEEINEQKQLIRHGSDEERLIGDDELKLRIVWAISSLISASARHYLLKKVVSEHLMLRRVEIGDGTKQGRVRMSGEQIEELRKNVNSEAEMEMERTAVPALKMKMWYAKELELKEEGWVVEGATVIVIRPVDEGEKEKERDCDLVSRVWNGDQEEEEKERVFGEAVREMTKKKKSCTLEMNSF